jgi:hypothetical protein
VAADTNSSNSSRRFLASSTFPPGRLRLSTRPIRTGSAAYIQMIGIVWAAALPAIAPCVLSRITITDT